MHRPTHLLAMLVSIAVLTMSGVACSSDGDSSSTTPETPAGAETPKTPVGAETAGDERASGIGRADLAFAVATATRAASHDVDGETIRFSYDEGSKDDPMASINCSVALDMKDPTDHIEMTYPDGAFECVDD